MPPFRGGEPRRKRETALSPVIDGVDVPADEDGVIGTQ